MVYYKILPEEQRLSKKMQEHIGYLRASIRTLQEALEQEVTDSNTFLQASYDPDIEDEALPKGARILFRAESESLWGRDFEVYVDGKVLFVGAHGPVMIKPTASNRLEIRMAD